MESKINSLQPKTSLSLIIRSRPNFLGIFYMKNVLKIALVRRITNAALNILFRAADEMRNKNEPTKTTGFEAAEQLLFNDLLTGFQSL